MSITLITQSINNCRVIGVMHVMATMTILKTTSGKDVKIDFVKEQLRKVLKQNNLCCCGGDYRCNNCKTIDGLREKTDHCCPNCYMRGSV